MARSRRIAKELEDVKNDAPSGVTLELISDSDISRLKGTLIGPPDTPYEGGRFIVDIRIPQEYPFKPPIMRFETRVYHPNISSQTGAICLDILKDTWSPVLTLKSSLLSLQSLLALPEPNDPQDAEVAGVYLRDKQQFDQTALAWTKTYALSAAGDAAEDEYQGVSRELVDQYVNMGFEKQKIVTALVRLGIYKLEDAQSEAAGNRIVENLL